jgi:hypothetical protein
MQKETEEHVGTETANNSAWLEKVLVELKR